LSKIKTIWLVNRYSMPPQYESRLRTIKFAHYLTKAGYKVLVFGSSVMHNMNINLIDDGSSFIRRQYDDIDFIHINTIEYKKTSGINRILSDIQFHYKLCRIANKFEKPDLIVATTYPYISNPLLYYSRRKGIKYFTEMLDVYPDNFVDFGLISPNNPIMKWMLYIAKRNYLLSDVSIFSWQGYQKYIEDKSWDIGSGGSVDLDKMFYINNGVDLSDFDKWKNENIIDDSDLNSFKKKVIYLGSVRLVNNLMLMVKAAEQLKERCDTIFLVYGDGCDRQLLIDYCKEHNISNVIFKDKWIDPKFVPFILSKSYLNILNYTSSNFGKYGISSSKLFQYLASGKPIICNIDIYNNPISNGKIGISKGFLNEIEYAEAIKTILDANEDEYLEFCQRASNMVKEFDYECLTNKFINIIK